MTTHTETKDNLPDPELTLIEESDYLYWLSFCDPEKPAGTQFLGVILTCARNSKQAIQNTLKLGINPGGEVMVIEISGANGYLDNLDRLLTEEMLMELDYV